jgi:hypothetical protein
MTPLNRVAMAQENLSRYLEQFKSRWQPSFDNRYATIYDADEAKYAHRCDRRDFEVELTNLVQAAFAAAQAEEAGAPEIEVTPAMIEAGAQELADSYMFDIETLESKVVSIFKVMVLASPRSRNY